jgi:hypothetical protein
MKKMVIVVAALMQLFVLSVPAGAAPVVKQEPMSFTMVDVMTLTAKVTDINYQTRTVQLTEPEGKVRTVTAGSNVRNLSNVKIGDTVTMEVNQEMMVEVHPGPGEPMNVGTESQTAGLPGEKPSSIRTIEGVLKTRVESIDYKARTFTCKNRKGVLATYKVGKDVKRFNEIQRGDMLYVEYKQIVAVSVK